MPDKSEYKSFLINHCLSEKDVAHDLAHIQRVVTTALDLAEHENADLEIIEAAAWLHDCVVLPKNHPERRKASSFASKKAVKFLSGTSFLKEKLKAVAHAIEAHSYSAGIKPETIEAKVVQDADRLDAIGAIGIARCFTVAGQLGRALYNPEDPFCSEREADDSLWTVDHFYTKLFNLPDSMNTDSARREGKKRVEFMKKFIREMKTEVGEVEDTQKRRDAV